MKQWLPKALIETIRHKPWPSFAMMFCLALVFFLFSRGIVDLLVMQPRYLMSMWEQGKRVVREDEWHDALQTMQFAIRTQPANPQYVFDLGRLYEWQALTQPVWSQHARENRAHAISYFREAARRQPGWALAWINLASSKLLNQELDPEAIQALDNAASYGPWEDDVHQKTIWLGIAMWQQLPVNTQQKILFIIEESVRQNKSVAFIREAAIHFQWQDNLFSLLEEQEI